MWRVRARVQALLGTNPLTVAAPAENGQAFFLDMATSAVALGKVYSYVLHLVLHAHLSLHTAHSTLNHRSSLCFSLLRIAASAR